MLMRGWSAPFLFMPEIKIEKTKLRLLFADILRGYTTVANEKYNNIYIKHLNPFDVADMDIKMEAYIERARSRGLPQNSDKEKELKESGLWDESKDRLLKDETYLLEGLKITLGKLYSASDKENINKQIKQCEEKINSLIFEKNELIGFTCEIYAQRKINEYFMFNSLFKDEDLKNKLFTTSEFDDLEEEDLHDLVDIYNGCTKWFNTINIQRIALSNFFLNIYYLCDDDSMLFWGKPIVNLSSYQIDLTTHARYFKNLLSNIPNRPSDDLMDNPDKLIDWHNSSKNLDKTIKGTTTSGEMGGTGIVGATSSEIKSLNQDGTRVADSKFFENLKKQGKGRIKMDEFIKMNS